MARAEGPRRRRVVELPFGPSDSAHAARNKQGTDNRENAGKDQKHRAGRSAQRQDGPQRQRDGHRWQYRYELRHAHQHIVHRPADVAGDGT
jgi:hypothetical protein